MNKYHNHGKFYNFMGAGVQFQRFRHYHHGGTYRIVQADVELKKETTVLLLDLQAAEENCLSQFEHIWVQIPPPQWHTSLNKATSTPKRPYLPTVPFPTFRYSSTLAYGGHSYPSAILAKEILPHLLFFHLPLLDATMDFLSVYFYLFIKMDSHTFRLAYDITQTW